MAFHDANIQLDAVKVDRIEEVLQGESEPDAKSGDTFWSETVKFDDGKQMDVKAVAGDPSYAEAVLFDANGVELGCTEPEDCLAIDFAVDHGGETYTTAVMRGPAPAPGA